MSWSRAPLFASALCVACAQDDGPDAEPAASTDAEESTGMELADADSTAGGDADTPASDATSTSTSTSGGPAIGVQCPDGTPDCVAIDLVVVVDDSSTMRDEQAKIANALPHLVDRLHELHAADGTPLHADVQVIVTNTSFGNPACSPVADSVAVPGGTPVTTGCNARIAQFTNPADPDQTAFEACVQSCPVDVVPDDDFVAFRTDDPDATNVADVGMLDVDGDGELDDPVARALACLGPQGIAGCGFEAQLESALQVLDPSESWNQGPTPFLRDEAILALAIFTDEADCSVRDYAMMTDATYFETHPDTGLPELSSAACWNAGVACNGPDASGNLLECDAVDGPMHPISRYLQLLEWHRSEGKEVVMLGVVGIPPVLGYDASFPHLPVSGGVADLKYRTWQDGPWPDGDIAPAHWEAGVTASDLAFEFGVGPGCLAFDDAGDLVGHATPPVRLRKVCEALDDPTKGTAGTRCCLESICDGDYRPAIDCLAALVENTTND